MLYLLVTPGAPVPLLAARLVSVAAGALTLSGCYVIGYLWGPEKPGARVLYLTAFSGNGMRLLPELWRQLEEALGWVRIYLTLPILGIALAGFAVALKSRDRNVLLLGSVFAILFCSPVFMARVLFPRYLLWAAPPLLVLAAGSSIRGMSVLGRVRNLAFRRAAVAALAVLLLYPGVRTAYGYIADCAHADLPEADRFQYVEAWPSGYGVREAAEFLEDEARFAPAGIDVICQEYGSDSHFGTRVLLSRDSNITVKYSPMRGDRAFGELAGWTAARPAYVLVETPPVGNKPEDRPDRTARQKALFLLGAFVLMAILCCPTYLVNQHMIAMGKNGANLDIGRRMASISPTIGGRLAAAFRMLSPFFGGILLLVAGLLVIGMCSVEGFWIGAAYVFAVRVYMGRVCKL